MRKAKALKVKGLRTPRIIVWIKGFIHGRILHTGGLDPDTDVISSGYVTGQIKRFRKACVDCRDSAQKALDKSWSEADKLLYDLAAVSDELDKDSGVPDSAAQSANPRAAERMQRKRSQLESDRLSILKRLSEIRNKLLDEFDHARNRMEATAEALLSVFSCYGHGLLMRPVYSKNLPAVVYQDCADQLLQSSHENTWNTMNMILDKEESV